MNKKRKKYRGSIEESEKKHAYYVANKEQILQRERHNRETAPLRHLIKAARCRAKQKGIPFNLSEHAFPEGIPKTCPVFGIPLYAGSGAPGPNSPSLDRVIPELGYTEGNVVIISHKANSLKKNLKLHEARALYHYIRRHCES